MSDRTFIPVVAIGAMLAAICCGTPILIGFGAAAFTAWLAKAYSIVIPALLVCLALITFWLYRRRKVSSRCASTTKKQEINS